MSCIDRDRNCECLHDLLALIIKLQDCSEDCDLANNGCDKPFLGPTPRIVCFNTRPVRLFRCLDGEPWTFPFTFECEEGVSSIFRIENLDGCCATFRILAPKKDCDNMISSFVATDSFFTINLECVGAISCLQDTFVENI